MNKKLFLAMALPAFLVGCSQDDLVSESVVATAPDARAIDNVTFTIAKNAGSDGVESRADWVNNKIKFEKSDKVSLYWLDADGLTAQSDGTFTGTLGSLSGALKGQSNAVFRTEDGASFTAEAVVYEGYNLLVYPANVKHTTAVDVVVSLPETQKAADDFAENAIYIGDSILHIHQPAKNTTDPDKVYKGYYNMYGHLATTEDPNTSGYAHGIKTGVKLLTSLLNMDLRINNAPANNVVINKVVLTTAANSQFNEWGNLKARGFDDSTDDVIANQTAAGSKAKYINPWFVANDGGKTDAVTLSFDGVTTNVSGSTKGTMLLLPTNMEITKNANGTYTTTNQPVLKVYTNYGIVTIGGNVAANDAQSNAIYKKDGVEKAAVNDNQALMEIVYNATNYLAKVDVYDKTDATDKKQDYVFNSGVSMTRVIKVDMAKAEMVGMTASTTEELNAILKAAVANPNNKFNTTNPLSVALIPNPDGEFTLTNYEGLDAFVAKFKAGALALTEGNNPVYGTPLSTVIMNTTSATELKDVEGLADAITLTIPATSKINAVKNGNATDGDHVITNAIVNKTTITLPKYSEITIDNNKDGKFIYTIGATMDVTAIDNVNKHYGTVYYKADTYNHMMTAAGAGVNYIEIADVTNAFFNGVVDLAASSNPANATGLGGITVELNNCGDLASTIEEGIETATIVLTNGSTYTNMVNADVDNVIVKSTNAKLGMGTTNVPNKTDIANITIAEGTTVIEQINATTIDVKSGATVTITKDCVAPTNLYVWGTASFAGSNNQTDEKVFVNDAWDRLETINYITGKCVVTGSLELKNDLAYDKVAVSATTSITVAEGVKGLGYWNQIHVSKAGQETATTNLIYRHNAYGAATRYSWDGVKFGTIQWGI